MKAVLNVETYLHCSQDLKGTQHGLWPGLSPNLHLSDYGRVARDPGAIRKSRSTTLRLPGTNLLDEWIGDLPLIAEVVASQLAKIICPTGRQNTSRTGSNGNPHPPAPDARASAVTARAPAQVAVA